MPRLPLSLGVLFALVLTVIAGYYLDPLKDSDHEEEEKARTLPGSYMENARTWAYSEAGQLSEVTESRKVTFYPSRKESLMVAPRFYSHDKNQETWSVSSDIGRLQHKREMLTLTGNVVMASDINQVQLNAERMRLDLRSNIATSATPVTLTHPGGVTRAEGMSVRLDTRVLRLRPNVETLYAPHDS